MKRALNCVVVVTAVALCASAASGAVIYRTVGELAVEADRIMVGDVVEVTSYWNEQQTLIRSHVVFEVSDYLKGQGGPRLAMEMIGGQIGDLRLLNSVSPTFEVGQRVLLFMSGAGNLLAGAFQGAYLTDGVLAVQMQSGCCCGARNEPRPLEDLLNEIAVALPGQFTDPITEYKGDFVLPDGQRYVLLGCDWTYQASPMGEVYLVNGNCVDGSAGSSANQVNSINRGADVWTDAGAEFAMSYGGTTTSTTLNAGDSQNIVFFRNTSGMGGSTLAATYYWCSGGNMYGWDMVYNDYNFTWWDGQTGSCAGMYDIQGVGAHEFGHTVGLGHSAVFAATMYYAGGPCQLGPRTLHQDDIDGLIAIYGPAFETDPPTPDPMTFSTLPVAAGADQIFMMASLATDAHEPCEYEFEFVSGGAGGDSRTWSTDQVYTDAGLATNVQYTYRVRARDAAAPPNATAFSGSASIYTLAVVPGVPIMYNITSHSMDLDVVPNGNPSYTEFAVKCTSQTPDPAWQAMFVDASGSPVASEVWQTEAAWDGLTISGLLASTDYCFTAKARNQDLRETGFSAWPCVSTAAGGETIVAAASLLFHGASELRLDLMASNVEPRRDGVRKLELEVSGPVSSVSASVSCVNGTYGGSITTTPSGTTVTVEFDLALPEGDCCDVTLTGDAEDSILVRTLKGDVDRGGVVATTDASLIKPWYGQTPTDASCQYDYDTSGTVATTDASLIKPLYGNTAPSCP